MGITRRESKQRGGERGVGKRDRKQRRRWEPGGVDERQDFADWTGEGRRQVELQKK